MGEKKVQKGIAKIIMALIPIASDSLDKSEI